MTPWRGVLVVGVFLVFCAGEAVLAWKERGRPVSASRAILRSAGLLFLFTAAVSLSAGLSPSLALGLAWLVAVVFPLQVAGVVVYQKKARSAREHPRNPGKV